MPHELFLVTRQTIKIRNAFANDMSTNVELIKAEISKKLQSHGSCSSWLGKLGKQALTNIAIPSARAKLPGLVSNLTSNAINRFLEIISGKGAAGAEKGFTLFTSNEDLNDIIKITKSLEDSDVLIDGVTESVKHEIKKTKTRISWSFVSTLSRFISATSNFSSSEKYKWKRSEKSR